MRASWISGRASGVPNANIPIYRICQDCLEVAAGIGPVRSTPDEGTVCDRVRAVSGGDAVLSGRQREDAHGFKHLRAFAAREEQRPPGEAVTCRKETVCAAARRPYNAPSRGQKAPASGPARSGPRKFFRVKVLRRLRPQHEWSLPTLQPDRNPAAVV